MIVAIKPAMRFRPPIIEGAIGWMATGNVLWAKFAVPVMVDRTMTGKLKRKLNFLNMRNAR
jgi:hypothetical protein